MKTKKIELYLGLLQGIRYQNENGGAYAYMQFLAYSRELLKLLEPLRGMERHIEMIEGINWLFNEYLSAKFTHRHRSLFDEKMLDLNDTIGGIRFTMQSTRKYIQSRQINVQHAQAA